jgi:hypothetical protein
MPVLGQYSAQDPAAAQSVRQLHTASTISSAGRCRVEHRVSSRLVLQLTPAGAGTASTGAADRAGGVCKPAEGC